jgi:hypothetical protein
MGQNDLSANDAPLTKDLIWREIRSAQMTGCLRDPQVRPAFESKRNGRPLSFLIGLPNPASSGLDFLHKLSSYLMRSLVANSPEMPFSQRSPIEQHRPVGLGDISGK